MDKTRYFLISKDERTISLFKNVFEGNLKVFDDLQVMLDFAKQTQVGEGAAFFDYELVMEQARKYDLSEKHVLLRAKDLFIKAICLVNSAEKEVTPAVMEYVYDVINLSEQPQMLEKKLCNMRNHTFMEMIINDVLGMSSLSDKKDTGSNERFNLFKMVSYIASVSYQKCVEKGLAYDLYIENDVPEFLIGDRIRLNQIFLNLMTSAVVHSEDGGKISFNVGKISQEGNNVKLKFVVEGSDIRLGVASRLMNLSNGTISVESDADKTTRITIIFNAKCDANLEVDEEEAARRFVNLRVAAISKDEKATKRAKNAFEKLGFTLDGFESVEELKKSFEGRNLAGNLYSVCVVDGELTEDEKIVKMVRAIPGMSSAIIIVMSYNTDKLRMEYLRAGANAVIGKPVSKAVIYNTLMSVMGRKLSITRAKVKSGFNFVGKRVLVVDDNELSLEIAKSEIKQSGAIVEVAHNGAEALFKFTTSGVGSYDLILMDIEMPEMDGYEATKEIRAKDRKDANLPIIALTSISDENMSSKTKEAGMNAFVHKPINIKELLNVLNGVVY